MTEMTLAPRTPALHAARAVAYRFFATVFRYPDRQVVAALAAMPSAASLAPVLDAAPVAGAELVGALEAIGAARGAVGGSIEDEYLRTFGHSIPKEFPPFETEFTSAQAFRQTADLADIAGFYRAFGVRVVPGLGERADALGVELEFLHLLAMKEAHALAGGLAEQADVVASATAKFLTDHVARWAPSCAKRIAQKGTSELYRVLGAALAVWLRIDLEVLGVPRPQPVDEPALLHAKDWGAEADDALDAAAAERAELEQLERARMEGAVRASGPAAGASDGPPTAQAGGVKLQ